MLVWWIQVESGFEIGFQDFLQFGYEVGESQTFQGVFIWYGGWCGVGNVQQVESQWICEVIIMV